MVIASDPPSSDPLGSEAGFPARNREALSKEEGESVKTVVLRIEGVSASACGVGIGILKDESRTSQIVDVIHRCSTQVRE